MKILLCVILIFSSFAAFSCVEFLSKRHTNPDGSEGGLISPRASVSPESYISYSAKVCDSAWIESGVMILDRATIQENAWVRGNSIISGAAVVGGSSLVWGDTRKIVKIQDYAQIFGNAKIMNGSEISGKSSISGSVVLDNVIATDASICRDLILSSIEISDNYFCNSESLKSKVRFDFLESGERYFPYASTIRLRAVNGIIGRKLYVSLNGMVLSDEDYSFSGDEIVIKGNRSQFIEGVNKLVIWGEDDHGFKIETSDIEINLGKRTISILLDENFSGSLITFKDAKIKIGGQQFKVETNVSDGRLNILGLPMSQGLEISVKLMSSTHVGWTTFLDSNVPSRLKSYSIPKFKNNKLDFSNDLSGWESNRIEDISVLQNNGKSKLRINSISEFYLSKTFNLTKENLTLGFELPAASSRVEVAVFSPQERTFQVFKTDSSSNIRLSKSTNYNSSNHTFILRINEGFEKESLELNEFQLYPVSIGFALSDLWVYMKTPAEVTLNSVSEESPVIPAVNMNRTLSIPTYSDPETCKYTNYLVQQDYSVESDFNNIDTYFSAGQFPDIDKRVKESRLYADIEIEMDSIKVSDLVDIHLIAKQNGFEKFRSKMRGCSFNNFKKDGSKLYHQKTLNLASFSFSVSEETLLLLSATPGSKVSLFLEVKLKIDGVVKSFESSEIRDLFLLNSPTLNSADYRTDSVDNYSIGGRGFLKTASDKWMLPGYIPIFNSIMASSQWFIGDISKTNGGTFRGHSGHQKGTDADIKFKDFVANNVGKNVSITHNFAAYGNDVFKWEKGLEKIEEYLLSISPFNTAIETIYITSSQKVLQYFNNRCVGGRFIALNLPNSKSLLNNEPNHENHLHIKFNSPNVSGLPHFEPLVIPSFDLDDIEFEISNDLANISVKPKSTIGFLEYGIFIRLQDSPRWENIFGRVQFAKWLPPKVEKGFSGNKIQMYNIEKPLPMNQTRYLHVTFAHLPSGGCIEREVVLESGVRSL